MPKKNDDSDRPKGDGGDSDALPNGRPTTLTDDLSAVICTHIAAGNYFSTACELAGVSENTARAWLRRGQGKDKNRPSNKKFAQFAQAIKKADAQCESLAVEEMQKAGKSDWVFHMTFLERKFPARWGRIERVLNKFGKMSEAELDEFIAGGEAGEGAADRGAAED